MMAGTWVCMYATTLAPLGLIAVRGREARAVAREIHHAVPDPQHLRNEDDHERQRQDHARVEQGEFDDGLPALAGASTRRSS